MGAKKKTEGKAKNEVAGKGGKSSQEAKPKGAQRITVRHILCEKHAKKELVLEELNQDKSVAKFIELARTHSEDKARQGGLLGTEKPRGTWAPAFEAVAFELAESTNRNVNIGEAKTEHGYHLIMVEKRV
ncbi:FKBP-like protein [Xylariomycetidae sp. FL0641]|nr:FKBP-like protein [Xylariomycetidae sp. FL0641]